MRDTVVMYAAWCDVCACWSLALCAYAGMIGRMQDLEHQSLSGWLYWIDSLRELLHPLCDSACTHVIPLLPGHAGWCRQGLV